MRIDTGVPRMAFRRPRRPMKPHSGLVAIVFTDVVSSAALLTRLGDDEGHRILHDLHSLLAGAARDRGGRVVKGLGDGLMVSFTSVAGALRGAVDMQLACRGAVGGERVAIRVGVNAGEALSTGTDFFGATVVTAHRLCRAAGAGQIFCSDVVVSLVAGRPEFVFSAADRINGDGRCRVVAYELCSPPAVAPSASAGPSATVVVVLQRFLKPMSS